MYKGVRDNSSMDNKNVCLCTIDKKLVAVYVGDATNCSGTICEGYGLVSTQNSNSNVDSSPTQSSTSTSSSISTQPQTSNTSLTMYKATINPNGGSYDGSTSTKTIIPSMACENPNGSVE